MSDKSGSRSRLAAEGRSGNSLGRTSSESALVHTTATSADRLLNDSDDLETMTTAAAGTVPTHRGIPPAVFLIVGNEFCERFSFYGMKTILHTFFTESLLFSDDSATASVHAFTMLAYFFPLFGAVLSDAYLGKFKTILYLSIVYCFGNLTLSVTAIPGVTNHGDHPHWWGAALGLLLLAIGTGGIKPCVSSFGGDQFHPSQTEALQLYFSLFYFSINAGSFLSTILTPYLSAVSWYGL